jgi:DNA-binding transcriptional ArsR family regulator
MESPEQPDMDRLLVELRHPLRRQLLRLMIDADPISPSELAGEIDVAVSNVAYHVRVLDGCGAIELVTTKQVRGSIQHFYRAAVKPEQARQALRLAEGRKDDPAGEENS